MVGPKGAVDATTTYLEAPPDLAAVVGDVAIFIGRTHERGPGRLAREPGHIGGVRSAYGLGRRAEQRLAERAQVIVERVERAGVVVVVASGVAGSGVSASAASALMTGVSASASSAVIPGGGVVQQTSASAASISARDGTFLVPFSADITTELSMFCLSAAERSLHRVRDAAQLRGLRLNLY